MNNKNIIYALKFDGQVLEYRCRPMGKFFFKLFGLNKALILPINVVANYNYKTGPFGITLIKLSINSYTYVNEVRVRRLLPILVFNSFGTSEFFRQTIDNAIASKAANTFGSLGSV